MNLSLYCHIQWSQWSLKALLYNLNCMENVIVECFRSKLFFSKTHPSSWEIGMHGEDIIRKEILQCNVKGRIFHYVKGVFSVCSLQLIVTMLQCSSVIVDKWHQGYASYEEVFTWHSTMAFKDTPTRQILAVAITGPDDSD